MGMRPRDIPLTRDDVSAWLAEYDGQIKDTQKLRHYLAGKLKEHDLEVAAVDTTGNDSLDDVTPLVDLIVMDLESYA